MPGDDKRLLDYFIKHTNSQFAGLRKEMNAQHNGLSKKLDRLRLFGFGAIVICIVLSPKGEKIWEILPKLLEVASAAALR